MASSLRGSFTVVVSVLVIAAFPGWVRADGAEAGGYLGAAFPVSQYDKTADIGGVIGGWGGYRWGLVDHVALSLIGNPQVTLLPSDDCPRGPRLVSCSNGDDLASTFSITAGPKLSLMDKGVEVSFAFLGGYFDDVSGPLDENGGGFAVHGTIGGYVGAGIHVGLFARFEEAFLARAADENDDDRQMVMTGLSVGWNAEPEPLEAPPLPPPPPPPPAPPPMVKRKIILRGVNFDFDKANIRPDAAPVLDEAIRALKGQPDVRVRVEGHTDSVGSDAYNQQLSERRAAAVMAHLVRGGIALSRLQAAGFGESSPIASNDTADGRAQNRRAELIVVE